MENLKININSYKINPQNNYYRQSLPVSFCRKNKLKKDEFSHSNKHENNGIKDSLVKIFKTLGLIKNTDKKGDDTEKIYQKLYPIASYKKAKERGLFNPIEQRDKEYPLSTSGIHELSLLPNKNFEYAKKLLKIKKSFDDKPLTATQVAKYARMCDSQKKFERISSLLELKVNTDLLIEPLIKLGDKKFAAYMDIISCKNFERRYYFENLGESYNGSWMPDVDFIENLISGLDKNQIERAKNLLYLEGKDSPCGYDCTEINDLSKLDEKKYERVWDILNNHVRRNLLPTVSSLISYSNLSDKNFEIAKKRNLFSINLSPNEIKRLVFLDDKTFERYEKHFNYRHYNRQNFRIRYELTKFENEEDFEYFAKEFNNQREWDLQVFFLKEGIDIHKKSKQLIESQYPLIKKNPELYCCNIDLYDNIHQAADSVIETYNDNSSSSLAYFAHIFGDSDSFNNFLRLGDDNVELYCDNIENLNYRQLIFLSNLCKRTDKNGKPLGWKDKLALSDLVCEMNNIPNIWSILNKLSKEEKFDIKKFNRDFLVAIMKFLKIEDCDKISDEELSKWDKKYLYTILEYIDNGDNIEDLQSVLKNSLFGDFKKYITDTDNIYGKANQKTKEILQNKGISYNKWVNPSPKNNVTFRINDTNNEKLIQISQQIKEDIETLRKTKAKAFVDKQLNEFITKNEFNIPNEVTQNKENLLRTLNIIYSKLNHLFMRAKNNISTKDADKKEKASLAMTIKDHLEQRIKDINELKSNKNSQKIDWTIKMWDRSPSKDLFQGSYSGCCIALDGGNGDAMPQYLLNTAFNMIEIVDNNSGETVGNALCYLANLDTNYNHTTLPALIIDNIEIRNSKKLSSENGKMLREAIFNYAKNITKSISGKNMPIYLGPTYNDVPCNDLKECRMFVKFLGEIATKNESSDEDEIYLDTFNGWIKKDKTKAKFYTKLLGDRYF